MDQICDIGMPQKMRRHIKIKGVVNAFISPAPFSKLRRNRVMDSLAPPQFQFVVFDSFRRVYIDYVVPPAFNRADHLSSALAASYSDLVFTVFQPRYFSLAVWAIPGVNRPILQH